MKYKTIAIITVASAAAWLVRFAITGVSHFGFLVPNVILASIPLLLEKPLAYLWRQSKTPIIYLGIGFVAVVWLLFLPNAFYMITDFLHLNSKVLVNAPNDGHTYSMPYVRGDGLYIYDSLLIFMVAAYGAYVGALALLHMFTFVRKQAGELQTYLAMGTVMALSSIGVYIGRFGRWNSWEGLAQPHMIVSDLVHSLGTEGVVRRFVLVVSSILAFELMSLLYVKRQL